MSQLREAHLYRRLAQMAQTKEGPMPEDQQVEVDY